MRTLLLVRHCESSGQAPDAPLTARGEEQARALADFLSEHPVDRIVSSPYARARASIEPFVARTGLPVDVDERIAERRLSPEPIDHWREVVERAFHDPAFRVPGGESGAETLARGWAAVRQALSAARRCTLLVSHGQLLSLVFQSIDPRFGFESWAALSNPDVYRLTEGADGGLALERIWR